MGVCQADTIAPELQIELEALNVRGVLTIGDLVATLAQRIDERQVVLLRCREALAHHPLGVDLNVESSGVGDRQAREVQAVIAGRREIPQEFGNGRRIAQFLQPDSQGMKLGVGFSACTVGPMGTVGAIGNVGPLRCMDPIGSIGPMGPVEAKRPIACRCRVPRVPRVRPVRRIGPVPRISHPVFAVPIDQFSGLGL